MQCQAWHTTLPSAAPWGAARHGAPRGRRTLPVCAGIKARWLLDIKYGCKLDAVELLQEWVREIGSGAGLTPANTALSSGQVGVAESKLEMELAFGSLAELEAFWGSIDPVAHRAWSQRLQELVVHGSPTWEVYRTVEAFPGGDAPAAAAQPAAASSSGGGLVFASGEDLQRFGKGGAPRQPPSTQQQTASGLSIVSSEEEADVILDWKGDPMRVNPGDRMAGMF